MFQLKVTWEWQVRVIGIKQNKWISKQSTYQDSYFPLTSLIIKDYGGRRDNSSDLQLTHLETQSGGGFPLFRLLTQT